MAMHRAAVLNSKVVLLPMLHVPEAACRSAVPSPCVRGVMSRHSSRSGRDGRTLMLPVRKRCCGISSGSSRNVQRQCRGPQRKVWPNQTRASVRGLLRLGHLLQCAGHLHSRIKKLQVSLPLCGLHQNKAVQQCHRAVCREEVGHRVP